MVDADVLTAPTASILLALAGCSDTIMGLSVVKGSVPVSAKATVTAYSC